MTIREKEKVKKENKTNKQGRTANRDMGRIICKRSAKKKSNKSPSQAFSCELTKWQLK